MTTIGIPRIKAVRRKSLNRVILKLAWLISVARSRDVVIFETSAGWNLIGPNSNHDRDPLTSIPRNITATSIPRTPKYRINDVLSQNCGFMANRITPPSPNAVRIHTNCFPQRNPKSNIEAGPSEWMEA